MFSPTFFIFLVVFGIPKKSSITADSGLPIIQISHDELGDDYPEVQEQVQLEDFFWTGSGDGPPDYLKKVHTGISKGKEVIVKTETVVATVYVDGNNEVDIPICIDCLSPNNGGIGDVVFPDGSIPQLNYSATDRRYWLLTVMSGYYSLKDNPSLEEKLARLYRLAFTRQQSRHLGINGHQKIAGISVTNGRERRQHGEQEEKPKGKDEAFDVEVLHVNGSKTTFVRKVSKSFVHNENLDSELAVSSEETADQVIPSRETKTDPNDTRAFLGDRDVDAVTLIPWELIQQHGEMEKQSAALLEQRPSNPLFQNGKVKVLIHNVTHISEDDILHGNLPTNYDDDVNSKIDDRPAANQTEIIYSVFVNGRPVLATTAANDMRYVTESEVRSVIGKDVYMKAEPYLREPMATPLAPATHSGETAGFFNALQNNTALVVVSSLAVLLLLLLFVALLLMGKAKNNERHLEVNRSTSQNELMSESHSIRPSSRGTILETEHSTVKSQDSGVQNFSYENELSPRSKEPRIHFPGPPPAQDSRRSSLTSTENTSDSSVYSPINPPAADVQRILEEKAASVFERKKRRQHQYDRPEGRDNGIYTSVVTEKKPRHKAKRRYLSENKVGSLETSPRQTVSPSSGDDSSGLDVTIGTVQQKNNYHRNKLLHQKSIYNEADMRNDLKTTEAINKEIIKVLQPTERSSSAGSIGSFLSMASVKAFPKSDHPEPLNRVLDPVFVTYYDHVEEGQPPSKSFKVQKQQQEVPDPLNSTTIATIEHYPSPKIPIKSQRKTAQSDNPDPGVIGPIVWERHKQRLNASKESVSPNESPIRDPMITRSHYEGLLEGAIQMYGSQDDLPMPLPKHDFTNKRKATKWENRGSSAGAPSGLSKFSCGVDRPATAQPKQTTKSNHSTQPPSPATSVWGGSSLHGSHSPIIRALSAGPYRSETLASGSSNSDYRASLKGSTNDVATAPLIEAIQKELRKFQKDS